jgi:hypothetical protein
VIDITSLGPAGDPDFLYAALDTTACAAFIKESRMSFVNAIQPHRKSRLCNLSPHTCDGDHGQAVMIRL